MSREEIKQSRVILRRIVAHLRHAHLQMGAYEDTVGFVDIIHHRMSPMPSLNYVTPRQNTAFVPSNHVQQGIDSLREKGRTARVSFAAGLYPPMFSGSLRDLGLEIESETPLMIYEADPDEPRKPLTIPSDVAISYVNDHQSMGTWWYVWRNAYYDVYTSTAEPLYIGRDMQSSFEGHQLNLILYRHRFPVAVIRMTMHENTAHLQAFATMKEVRSERWDKMLRVVALDAAIHAGCDLIFATGKEDNERKLYRDIGFTDSGNIVNYAELSEEDNLPDESLTQSVLVI